MTATLDIQDGKLIVQAGDRFTRYVTAVPGMRAIKDTDRWEGPVSWAALLALKSEFSTAGGVWVTPAVEAAIDWFKRKEAVAAQQAPTKGHDIRLRDYQKLGSEFLGNMESVLLTDEMGLGKTVQALDACRRLDLERVLVVTTNSMKFKWADEASIWWPEALATVIHGTATQRRKQLDEVIAHDGLGPQLVVINWEALRLHTRLIPYGSVKMKPEERQERELNHIEWDCVIADEVHKAKDPKSKQTRALKGVARTAQYRWGMTGTPVLNDPGDLWSLLDFVDPGAYGTRRQFGERYLNQTASQWGGAPVVLGLRLDTRNELHKVLDSVMLRRLKTDVLSELPDKTYETLTVPLTPKQATAYRRMQKEMMAVLDDEVLTAADPLVKLARLSQIASALPVLEDGEVIELDTPSNKISTLLELLEETPGQVVVFAHSRKLLELADRELTAKDISTVSITGTVDARVREAYVRQFQEGDADVCLVSLGAGSEGITLTAAQTAVFLQRPWSLGQSLQAEDRIHRIGQEADKVLIIDVVSRGTVDEDVVRALRNKSDMADEVTRDSLVDILKRSV